MSKFAVGTVTLCYGEWLASGIECRAHGMGGRMPRAWVSDPEGAVGIGELEATRAWHDIGSWLAVFRTDARADVVDLTDAISALYWLLPAVEVIPKAGQGAVISRIRVFEGV